MALNRLHEMVKDMASRPGAEHGYPSKKFYEVGKEYGLTCMDVYRNCLTADARLSRGRYCAQLPKQTVCTRRRSKTQHLSEPAQHKNFTACDKAARLRLIASIAKRFAREDAYLKSLQNQSA